MDDKDLQELLDYGVINEEAVMQQLRMMKEKEILAVHPYAISQLPDGRWQTVVKDETRPNGRKEIKLSSYDKVIKRLADFYTTKETTDTLTLKDVFPQWLEYKCKKKNNKSETKKQNQASYEKYVAGTKIDGMKLKDITTVDLEEWAIEVLINNKMTAKTFNNHKITVTGTLAYAKRKGYISTNPWIKEELEYNHLFKSTRRKPSAAVIFYPDEIDALLQEFERGYQLNGNIANLGLTANFDLGLRIGELCTLKWTDVNWNSETIFIQRQEDSEGTVEEYVKKDSTTGYRELALSVGVINILKRIKHDRFILSEFIFSNEDGSRADKMKFEHRIAKAELSLGWKVGELKYTHCIRRTVASRMLVSGTSLEEIRRWLGHTDIQTTLNYIYNPFREDKTREHIRKNSILSTNKECLQVSTKNIDDFKQKEMLEAL